MKDRDLQSAIYSRAGSDIIMLILDFNPAARVKMLENRNKCHETAIEWALHQEDINVFKLLLEQCIKYGALKTRKGSRCSTFLHQCIVGKYTKILDTYMQVCAKENVDYDHCPIDSNACIRYRTQATPRPKTTDPHGEKSEEGREMRGEKGNKK